MKRAALLAVVAPLLIAGTAFAQPVLKVKANTIVQGVQSSTNTVTSGQIVSFTQPIPSDFAFVNYFLENVGTQTLTITFTSFCENEIWSCEVPPATIAPNHTAEITMTFGGTSTIPGANPLGTMNLSTNAGAFNLVFQGIEIADPTMTIVSGDGINVTAQPQPYTYTYPSTTVGVPVSRAFTITDTANNTVDLSIYQYSLVQEVGSCFSLIAGSLPNTVVFGTPLAVRYRMDSATAGPCKAVINMTTNAAAFPTFSFTLSGTVTN